MTLEFRDHQILVIAPGTSVFQVQMGLSESLMPPAYEIPAVVYRDLATNKFSMTATGSEPIYPVASGSIVNEAAFNYILKMICKSVSPVDGLLPAVSLVACFSWTRRQMERITHYMFEEIGIPALSISLQGTVTSYAFATSDCLVIDIGQDKTEISAVTQFETNRHASAIVNVGGNSVNAELSQILPQLSSEQIEDLKRSDIFEVLSESQASVSASTGHPNSLEDEDEGVVDIAAIVSSGNTREILERREKQMQGEIVEVSNFERSENTFIDRNGEKIKVGKERFQGCNNLMNKIVDAIADVIHRLSPRDQTRVFENVILAGKGSLVKGLKVELAHRIESRYVIRNRGISGIIAIAEETDTTTQGPTSLMIAKLPDHFPEWKNRKWEEYSFLGAQIGSKQVFTTGMEGLFVSRQDYNEVGPSCIWDVCS